MLLKKIPKEYQSIIVIVIGLLIWYLVINNIILLYAAIVIGIISFSQYATYKIHWLWMKLAWVLSLVVPKVVLSIIYLTLLVPMSIVAKIFGKEDPLFLKQPEGSNFILSNKKYLKKDLENLW